MSDREALIERIAKGMAEFTQDPEMETCTDAIEFVLKAIEEDHLIILKSAEAIAELAKPLEWKDRHDSARTDFQNNMRFEVMDMYDGTWALFISQRGCTDQVEDEFPTIEKAQEAANERYRAELAKSFDHFPVNNKKSG